MIRKLKLWSELTEQGLIAILKCWDLAEWLKKDSQKNILYVAYGSDSKYLLSDEAIIEDVNFISDKHPTFATAKFRYRSEDVPVTIEYIDEKHIRVKYTDGKAVTPGQACVVYLGEQCLMGGIIKQVFKDGKELWYLK